MFSFRIDDHLELRLHEEHHAEALYEVIEQNREHIGQWLPFVDWTDGPDDTLEFIRGARKRWAEGRAVPTSIWLDGQLVGTIGFVNMNREQKRAEIGYWLAAEHQGKGIVTRATRALVDYGFAELGLYRIEVRCEPSNERSFGVPERLGFTFEGVARGYATFRDRQIDHRVYSILRDEWDG
ncbi:GNAT family N-acetyltransferase [Persicimonas caeni]|uniref:GNAT family N-acetyltransferase n=1 Tax=Persicimonas caeni TaxID=2292766 RepID=A0A4Y6PWC6_PERCE|nr:GNAT family protein [Persicimonas caeni]QDG52530.1 GNAT family N-acetyltransferase [Persicimonas caeni]QED33752.1 GNAT family N-acetyltransferase [Persicimonas caeni]